jgi:hypothetical protein
MNFDHTENYWGLNKHMLILEYFRNLYEKDKSKSKVDSSNLMWAISFCTHPKSPIFSVRNKWEEVKKSIMKDEKLNWDKYKDTINQFKETVLTVPEKSYLFWCEHMYKREDFVRSIDYLKEEDIKRIDLAEDMAAKTPKLYVELARIKEQLEAEDKGKTEDKNKSLADGGQI